MYLTHRRLFSTLIVSLVLVIATISSAAFVSTIPLGTEGTGGILPGVDVSDSPFADIVENSTPSDLATYEGAYERISERPFVIEVDLQGIPTITEVAAISTATSFIEEVFTENETSQLEIDDRITYIYGVLPRWSISFKNSSITTSTSIVATVFVNAISGVVIGYIGVPILQNEPIDNVSAAETCAINILNHFGFVIPLHARYRVQNHSKMNRISMRFIATVNDVLIESSFGSLAIQIDVNNGGLISIFLNWMNIQEIPREGILPADRVTQNGTLTLKAILTEGQGIFDTIYDTNSEMPIKMQLVWVKKDSVTGDVSSFDAFTGELVEYQPTFGRTVYDTHTLLVAPIVGSIGIAIVAYLFGKRILVKSRQL